MNIIFKEFSFFNTNKGIQKLIELRDATLASDTKIKDTDYIIDNGKVIIIDRNTGLKKPGSKWKDSIPEMVEIKEEIELILIVLLVEQLLNIILLIYIIKF